MTPRRLALGLATAALTLATVPAYADVPPPPSTAVTLSPGGIAPDKQESNGYDFTDGGADALATAATQDVAPGLKLTNFSRMEPGGWNRGNVLTADLSTPTLSMDVRNTGKVAGIGTLTSQMAGTGAVAGVNGEFFDMNYSGAPVGTSKAHDRILNATSTAHPAFTVTDAKAAIADLTGGGTVRIDGVAHQLAGFNSPEIPSGGIGVYTSQWGDYTLDRPMGGPDALSKKIARATVVDGVVTAVATDAGAPEIPAGGQVVIGREAGADVVGALKVGDHVDLSIGLDHDVDVAVSGNDRLVVDGQVDTGVGDDGVHSRTAIGVSKDGEKVIVLALDGQTTASRGMTRAELGAFMKRLGAYEALNLDGGGSTTMAARVAGTTAPTVVDTPSDGHEREVSNSLLFFSHAGAAGRSAGAQIRPVTNRSGAYTVLRGQQRTLYGSGLDADYAAVEQGGRFRATGPVLGLGDQRQGRTTATTPRWSPTARHVVDGRNAYDDRDRVAVTGRRTGDGEASFTLADGHRATMPLKVLGPLDHLGVDKAVVPLPDPTVTSTVMLTGYDGDGRAAPIEPDEVKVTADPGLTVTPDGANGFTVRATMQQGSGVVDLAVGDHHVTTTVLVGLEHKTIADFSDAASWKPGSARATVSLTPVPGGGPTGQDALRIQHDFTASTATRGAYALPPAGITVPGQPLSLSLWVKGDGHGTWPRIQITSGNGTVSNLDGPLIDFTGWQQLTFPVPAGTAMPIRVDAIRMMETRPDALYHGDLTVAGLVADVPPDSSTPSPAPVQDPVVVTDGTVDDRPQRIAVMSDGQFVARSPDSPLVADVRQTLRQIVAAHPDHLVIDGDFVDEASPADIAFAKKVLDEEVGSKIPYTYVPGNHEVMGGPISNFKDVFGATHTSRRLGSTLLITLNSSSGTLHGNDDGTRQLTELESQLSQAATDPSITGVLLAFHHPVDDPLPDKASQLGDRTEAQQLEDRLGRFRTSSGKSVAIVNGHVGVFHGSSAQGISMLVNGNSGKTPAGNVTDGGFRGWTMLGISPARGVVGKAPTTADRLAWLRAETHPAVDTLSIGAPSSLAVGSSVTLRPTFTQGSATVPVAWPVSARWSGDGVQTAGQGHGVVRLDPATHVLTALRPGLATVSLSVNGVRTEARVSVTR